MDPVVEQAEREDYEQLLSTSGWKRLVAWAETEWADKLAKQSEAAADRNDAEALNLLRQIIAGKRAAQLLLEHPRQRIIAIKGKENSREASAVAPVRGGFR